MKATLIAGCMLFAWSSAFAQTRHDRTEFSLSGSLGSITQSIEVTGSSGTTTTDGESENYLSLIVRPGFFLSGGLEFEPELLWTAQEGTPPSFTMSGNLSYNFEIPESRIAPFVLVGYGTGNSIALFQRVFFRMSDKPDISVLNIGGGCKVYQSESSALRIEYRYQRYVGEETDSFGSFSSTIKQTMKFHNVFFGYSVFL